MASTRILEGSPIALKGGPVYDVRAYGAVGDGTTDDATALQATIDAAVAASGGTIFFPQGTYLIGTPLTITGATPQVYLVGAGFNGASQLKPTNSFSATTALLDIGDDVTLCERWGVSGLSFTGRSPDSTLHSVACIRTRKVAQFRISNCYFGSADYGLNLTNNSTVGVISDCIVGSNLNLAGIRLDIVGSLRVVGNHILEGRTGGGGKGIDANRAQLVAIVGNLINDWESWGVDISAYGSAAEPCTVVGNDIWDTGGGVQHAESGGGVISSNTLRLAKSGNGINITGNDVVISGNAINWTTGNGIRLAGVRCQIVANLIRNPTGKGVDMPDATECLVEGNKIYDDQGTPTMTYGIEERLTADKNIVRGNYISGATTRSIGLIGADSVQGENNRTSLVAGDVSLSAGWGSTATVSAISGTDTAGELTVSCSGSGFASNPTATLTFKDGAWPAAPYAVVSRTGGNQLSVPVTASTTTTTLVVKFVGSPLNGDNISFAWIVK